MTSSTTRRAMLAGIAAAPAASLPALAHNLEPDPIYAAIEAHRRAWEIQEQRHAEHRPVYEEIMEPTSYENLGRLPTEAEQKAATEHPLLNATYDRWCEASEAREALAVALVNTMPTTIAGAAAAAAHLAERAAAVDDELGETELLGEPGGHFHVLFARTVADGLARLAEASAA